jgi:hypothetical protein
LIVGDPVDNSVAVAAEFVRRHVKRFFVGHCLSVYQETTGKPFNQIWSRATFPWAAPCATQGFFTAADSYG